jgi:hypothetical protein
LRWLLAPAWDTQLPAMAHYPDSKVLASGWLVGEKSIAGRAPMIDAPMVPDTWRYSEFGRGFARKFI